MGRKAATGRIAGDLLPPGFFGNRSCVALPPASMQSTLPHELNGWVQLHDEVIYTLLFKAVWKTLKAFGADPKRLNGKLGMTAVLVAPAHPAPATLVHIWTHSGLQDKSH